MLESTSPARDAPCAQRRAQRPPEASGLGHLQQALQGVQGGGSPLGLTQVLPHSSLHSAPASLLQQACAAGFFLASSVQAMLTHWSAVCAQRDRVPSPASPFPDTSDANDLLGHKGLYRRQGDPRPSTPLRSCHSPAVLRSPRPLLLLCTMCADSTTPCSHSDLCVCLHAG